MRKSIKYLLISILTLMFIYTPKVLAASDIERTEITIDGQYVYKRYDNKATGQTNIDGGSTGIVMVDVDGKEYPGFCIDFGVSMYNGTSGELFTLREYFQNVLSATETDKLIKKLTLYARYGYGSAGRTTDKYYLATQELIWNAINETGFYNSDFYSSRAGKKFDIDNLGWTLNKTTLIDVSAELAAINNSIKAYYKTPSFCSSQNKIEIEVGETAEYTDNNGVLSQYQVTCSNGITCNTNGNKLTVTATDKAGNHKITFVKPESGGESYVYRVGETQGIIIVEEGIMESVSCEFGIDSFKNEQTSDTQIIYVITIGIFCATMAYITYYTKKSLNGLK